MDYTHLALSHDLAGERDRAHEGLILAVTELLTATQDHRYVRVQAWLVAMRSAAAAERMAAL